MRSLAPLLPPIPWRGTASGKSTALGHGLGCDGGGSPRPQVMKCVPRGGGAPLPPHVAHRRGGHRWCWSYQAVRHSSWRCRIACVCEGGVPNRPRTLTPRDPASGRIHQPAGLGEHLSRGPTSPPSGTAHRGRRWIVELMKAELATRAECGLYVREVERGAIIRE